jgi:hypothetical protein
VVTPFTLVTMCVAPAVVVPFMVVTPLTVVTLITTFMPYQVLTPLTVLTVVTPNCDHCEHVITVSTPTGVNTVSDVSTPCEVKPLRRLSIQGCCERCEYLSDVHSRPRGEL